MAVMDRKVNEELSFCVPSHPATADDLLDKLSRDEPLDSPEGEQKVDLAEIRRDPTAHITSAVLRCLLSKQGQAEREAVFPHLCTCSWCITTLHEAIRLSGTEDTHPANQLLKEAKEWAQYDSLGHAASERARRELLEQGIGYVYGKDGNVYRRSQDGSDDLLVEAGAE